MRKLFVIDCYRICDKPEVQKQLLDWGINYNKIHADAIEEWVGADDNDPIHMEFMGDFIQRKIVEGLLRELARAAKERAPELWYFEYISSVIAIIVSINA